MITLDSLIPLPAEKITPEIHARVDTVLASLTGIRASHDSPSIPRGTLSRYKAELRKTFALPPRSSFEPIMAHPKLRLAIEYIVVRSERSDKNTLRTGKHLSVVAPNGELLSIEAYVKSLYVREGTNANACHDSLLGRCRLKLVVYDDGTPATANELPSVAAVTRFLRNYRINNLYVRRARARKHDWEVTQEPFVTRDPEEYRPGELWYGDHTELDFLVINERGKLDRRWITAWTDMRTRLIPGYVLSWQPCSQTIALSFRNAVTGQQLRAYNSEDYIPLNIQCVPENVEIDNGKDYRSKYTQRVFGKIDFEDDARMSVQRITNLHYAIPYHGQSKAEMERWFGTIQTMLKYLPGYKGSNARKNQPDTLKQEIAQGEIMTVETFDRMIALAVNTYNNKIHRGLKNQSPLQCYLTNQTHNRTIDERVLDYLMMKVRDKILRRSQFTLFGNEYYSESLVEWNGRKSVIYYNPLDLGFVAVYVDKEFKAVAINKEMIGKDEHGWLKILRDRKRNEREMQQKIKETRGGISRIDAKLLLLEGQFSKATAVPAELLQSGVPNVALLTGLEGQAIEQQKELEDQKAMVEFEKEAKKKSTRLTIAAVNKIR